MKKRDEIKIKGKREKKKYRRRTSIQVLNVETFETLINFLRISESFLRTSVSFMKTIGVWPI